MHVNVYNNAQFKFRQEQTNNVSKSYIHIYIHVLTIKDENRQTAQLKLTI
jgi:hypothetical protein